jgi:hypothetical protein
MELKKIIRDGVLAWFSIVVASAGAFAFIVTFYNNSQAIEKRVIRIEKNINEHELILKNIDKYIAIQNFRDSVLLSTLNEIKQNLQRK